MVLRHSISLSGFFALVALVVVLRHDAAFAAGPGGVTGIVFLDKNGNGIRDAGEPGFSGVVVTLFGKKAKGSSLYLWTRTDAEGKFAFAGALIGADSSFTVSTGGAPLAATVPTTYRPARTFYTATDGDDRNPGNRDKPFRSIGRAVPMLTAGDLLYIRQGEYRECISSAKAPLDGGSGWDRPIVVAGLPGETVVIRPPAGQGGPLINLTNQRQQYLVFDNLVLDAERATVPLKSQSRDSADLPPSHVRVINCELENAKGSAAVFNGEDHQIINCRVHDNGDSNSDHGLEVGGGHSLIQGCDIYHNAASGILVFSGSADTASDNVIRGNRVHDNGVFGGRAFGIGIHSGRKNLVYDNVVWGNPFGIALASGFPDEPGSHKKPRDKPGPKETSIFNNTIYGNHGPGILIWYDNETRDNLVRNNIVIGNPDPNLANFSESTRKAVDHNIAQGNPRFRDPKANDFHLEPGSPAIDVGTPISQVRIDHDGIPRPQGKGYDCGAYEFSDDSFVPTINPLSNVFAPGGTYRAVIGFTKKPKPAASPAGPTASPAGSTASPARSTASPARGGP